jgi:hypothetical protein
MKTFTISLILFTLAVLVLSMGLVEPRRGPTSAATGVAISPLTDAEERRYQEYRDDEDLRRTFRQMEDDRQRERCIATGAKVFC